MERLTSLTAFHRVVEEKEFAAAARALRISPAMVSKHVHDLEDHLGVRLLHRTTRSMAVTDAGARFYKESKMALALLADAERTVAGDQEEPGGLLRVAAPGIFSAMYLAPVLPEFLGRFPAVRLELFCDDRVVDLVAQNFDLALRIGRLPDSSLIARKIARVAILVCAAPSYLERAGVPASPADLTRHACLQYEYQWARNGWELEMGDGSGAQVVHLGAGSCRTNNGEVLRQLALAGEGIVQLPDFIVGEDIKAGRLVTVLEDFCPEDRWLQAVFLAGRYLPANVRAFIDFCVERLGAEHPAPARRR